MNVLNPFHGDKNDRYRIFQEIEERNSRVKKPGLHISVNPTVGDLVRIGDAGVREEIENLMKHLGYGDQPYLVYKHADIDRVHFHVVSTRIDQETGKKIKDNYEKEKTQRFIKSLEQKYQLTKDENPEKLNYRFSGSSKNIKQNLESLFGQLNQMEFITSKQMYDEASKLFNVEIRRSRRGHLVFVIDEKGNLIRYPVRMSEFEERPKFYLPERQNLKQRSNLDQTELSPGILKSLVLKELMRQAKTQFDDRTNVRNKKYKLKSYKSKFRRKL